MEDVAPRRPSSRSSSEGAVRPTPSPLRTVTPAVEPQPVVELGRALRWRWKPALALAVLFAAGVVAYAESLPDEYEARAVVAVEPRQVTDIDDDVLDRLVPKYAELATAETTDRVVSRRLGLEPGTADVDARVVFESGLVQVFVRDESPEVAARRADAIAGELERFSVRDPRLDALVVSAAEVPTVPAGPPRRALEAAGLVAGLLLAAGLVLLLERLRPRVRSVRDVEALTGYSLLGRVPLPGGGAPGAPAHAGAAPLTAALERRLPRDAGVVAVVGASGGDAEAAVVRSFASAIARSDRQLAPVAPRPGDETDAATAAAEADAVVLVVVAHAPAGRVRAVAATVGALGVPVVGFVAVGFRAPSESSSVFSRPSAA